MSALCIHLHQHHFSLCRKDKCLSGFFLFIPAAIYEIDVAFMWVLALLVLGASGHICHLLANRNSFSMYHLEESWDQLKN